MVTSPPSITALPLPPDPNDRSTFNSRAYPWSVAQQTLATEVAAVADNVFDNAAEAEASASAASDSAVAAAASAVDATNNGATQVALAADQVELSQSYAQAAQAAALSAASAPGTNSTSTTSLTVGTGIKTLQIQTGKLYIAGQWLSIGRPGVSMVGTVSSYNSTTGDLFVDVQNALGEGTFNNWTVGLSGPAGSGGGARSTAFYFAGA